MNIILLVGSPNAGKGTIAQLLMDFFQGLFAYIATGNVFRHYIRRKRKIGLAAKSHMDVPELVPDSLTLKIFGYRLRWMDVKNALQIIFDGFPRTIEQAKALLEAFPGATFTVLFINVSEEEVVSRSTKRFICKTCSSPYSTDLHPGVIAQGVCTQRKGKSACGGLLYKRIEDTEEGARKRYEEFVRITMPVLLWLYNHRIKILEICGDQCPDVVFADVCAALNLQPEQVLT